jgi:ectoine hydroxylase-related dioxygenase (phytanoyl-CoA dioxygenase family)
MNANKIRNSITVHGVTERNKNKNITDLYIEEIYRNGYSVIKNVLNKTELDYTRNQLDFLYKSQINEFGAEKISIINDKYITRSMLVYDDFFLHRIACNKKILNIIKRILGNNISLSSQVGILSPIDDVLYQKAWHRELQYQHFTSSRPIALQSLICIDPFTEPTGATFFLPGSHLHEPFPSDEYVLKNEVQIIASPGDAVVFNALTYHRAGINKSNNIRRAINNLYTLPIIQQQINFSRMMNGRFKDDNFLAGLLGYRWETADSVLAWRQKHFEQIISKV